MTIKAVLERYCYSPTKTLGRFFLDKNLYFTVEKPWANNLPNISCIPDGIYYCEPYISRRFGPTYQIIGVPNRSYILFHSGNTANDSTGCIILGMRYNEDTNMLEESRIAVAEFLKYLKGTKEFKLEVKQIKICKSV